MTEQQQLDLTPTMQEMMAQMAAMRAELTTIKARTDALTQPEAQGKPALSTTRRKALRRLAGGLLAGLGVAGMAATLPGQAEAKFVAASGAGAIVLPPGSTVSGSLSSNAFGLVSSPDSTLALNSLSTISKAGVTGITTSTANFTYGVYGSGGSVGVGGVGGANGTGVTGSGRYGVTGIGTLTGVRGDSTTDSNSTGVYGNSSQGSGVIGNSFYGVGTTGTSNQNYGVWGSSTNSYGIYAQSTNSFAIYAQSTISDAIFAHSTDGAGVTAQSTNSLGLQAYGKKYGAYGYSTAIGTAGTSQNTALSNSLPANSSVGVFADAGYNLDLSLFGDNQNIGLYVIAGTNGGRTATAGVFNGPVIIYGNLQVSGNITANGAKPFMIDHPLDPANKYLYHIAIESPDMMNIYNGIATLNEQGEAIVEMPGWFEALNSDYRYQLTSLAHYAPVYIAEEIKNLKFKIAGGLADQKVSWQVTGIRQDAWAKANRIPVEKDKTGNDKGKYLHPEVFGLGEEFKITL